MLALLACMAYACQRNEKQGISQNEAFVLKVPPGFPDPVIPEDNQLTAQRVALGKKLFFEPILSLDSSLSCGSCHFQHLAFSDSVAVSPGVHGKLGMRNAPSLANVAYNSSFFWDGGVPTLEMQVIAPVETEEEMHLSFVVAVERLKQHPEYPKLIQAAYQREVDVFSITRAIAAFERTLISGNAKYDQHVNKSGSTLSSTEELGRQLFFSDSLQCSSCHSGFNFTSGEIVSNGLFKKGDSDPGRMRITLREEDEGKFKIPSLRNVALTSPYMHDGRFNSLEEVLVHYASGGYPHPNKSEKVRGFSLTKQETSAVIAFLHTLTDTSFVKNNAFKP